VPLTLLLESLYNNKVILAKDRSLNGITTAIDYSNIRTNDNNFIRNEKDE